MARLSVGDKAPNFDLASTEDCVLMLTDEVPRSFVLLYFFDNPGSERTRGDLQLLASRRESFVKAGLKTLALSSAKLEELKSLQGELGLPFPLLSDDRGFASSYGIDKTDEGEAPSVLVLIDRDQRVLWLANPVSEMAGAVEQIQAKLSGLPSSTVNYPRTVINRLVDLWVN